MGFSLFRLEAELKSAAIIQGALTLESLLAAAVNEATGRIRDEALSEVPIDTIDAAGSRLWMASGVFFGGSVRRASATIVRKRRFTEIGPDFYEPNARARKLDPYRIDQSEGDYKALMNAYPTVKADRLVWFARGDAQACAQLLRSLMWIGKRRGQGFGEIGPVEVHEVDESPLVDAHGMVRRPVPVDQLDHVPGAAPLQAQRLARVPFEHPTWAHPPVLCAVPHSQGLTVGAATRPSHEPRKEVFYERSDA